jgi:hypothetical protein
MSLRHADFCQSHYSCDCITDELSQLRLLAAAVVIWHDGEGVLCRYGDGADLGLNDVVSTARRLIGMEGA